jgi:dihydropteroate synthase
MMDKTTYFYPNKMLRMGNQMLDLSTPAIMGILNVTPDSFFDGGKYLKIDAILMQTERMLNEGADIIDIGGMSTRPGAESVPVDEELSRVIPAIEAIKKQFPTTKLSVDTVHAMVAEAAVAAGAGMINDVSAGNLDTAIIDVAISKGVPYVLMHMQGTPLNMQIEPSYKQVTAEVFDFLLQTAKTLHNKGLNDIIIDPGFGFGKTLEHNYSLAANLEQLKMIGKPILVGISRKSMICKLLKVNPEQALNGSSALHALLLLKGADILRVHDVKEAAEVRMVVNAMKRQ